MRRVRTTPVLSASIAATLEGLLRAAGRARYRERARESRTGRGPDPEPTVTALLPEPERRFPLLWSAEP